MQLFFAPTRLNLRRAVGVDALSAADQAAGNLFDLRALSLCVPCIARAPASRWPATLMPGVPRRYAIATTVMLTLTYGAGELESCCACSVRPARETDSSGLSRGGSGRCDPNASGE